MYCYLPLSVSFLSTVIYLCPVVFEFTFLSVTSSANVSLLASFRRDQGNLTMESFQMRPKCLKSIILCLESLFS